MSEDSQNSEFSTREKYNDTFPARIVGNNVDSEIVSPDSAICLTPDTPENIGDKDYAARHNNEVEEVSSENEIDEVVVTGSMQFSLRAEESVAVEESVHAEKCTNGNESIGKQDIMNKKLSLEYVETAQSGLESDIEDNAEVTESHSESGIADISASTSLLGSPNRIPTSIQLPETVTRLDTPQGGSVFLVGTAHFSKESQEDVSQTICLVRPDVVVVELCKARTDIFLLDEDTILRESRELNFKKIRTIVRQHGKIEGILYILLLYAVAHITKQLGMAPGGEFRAAFAEVQRSAPGCLIQLGDRPIHITLSRVLSSLSIWHKIKLAWHILTASEPISKEEVEKYKQRDFMEEMLAEMTGEFPAISEVLVKERDIYLTRSLQAAAQSIPNPLSPGGFTPRVVVGVVGIGHVPGIVERWGKVRDEDIPPILMILLVMASSASAKDSENIDCLYSGDSYSHVVPGLIYVESFILDSTTLEENICPKGCICLDNCITSCACKLRSGFIVGDVDVLSTSVPIYGCNDDCLCNSACDNRIIEKGPRRGLLVKKTANKGFGLFTNLDIPKGSYVCEYAGEVICKSEAEKRLNKQLPNDSNYILILKEYFNDCDATVTVVDPTVVGNIGRYINHSCSPNLVVLPVRVNYLIPHICSFAKRDIYKGEELCYDYGITDKNYSTLAVPKQGSNRFCHCNSDNCKGTLPFVSNVF